MANHSKKGKQIGKIGIVKTLLILVGLLLFIVSLFMQPNVHIVVTEGATARTDQSSQEHLEIRIHPLNPIHRFIYNNKTYLGNIMVDDEQYEAVSIKLSEQQKIYLDSEEIEKGKHAIEIIITDISSPDIVYGTKRVEIAL